MNLGLWKEEYVTDPDLALARARAGAAYFDRRYGPDWDRAIDLDRLDIASPFGCVLGQLARERQTCILLSPHWAVEYALSCGLVMDLLVISWRPRRVVRSYELLTDAWKLVLTERRAGRDSEATDWELVAEPAEDADPVEASPTVAA